MHDEVSVGDELTATPPQNSFEISDDASQHIFLAGGIDHPAPGDGLYAGKGKDCHLHYCSKSVEETAFMDEVKALLETITHSTMTAATRPTGLT